MNSINLQKSLEKLALLNLIAEQIKDSNNLMAICLKGAYNESPDELFDTIKEWAVVNYKRTAELLGEPLLNKILTHS